MMNDIFWIDIITPFQGLSVWRFQRWTLSNAQILCAFSALESGNTVALYKQKRLD
jgi:hypothetical protein